MKNAVIAAVAAAASAPATTIQENPTIQGNPTRWKHLMLLTLVGAIALCFVTAGAATALGNGYVYNAKGRLVGHVESDGSGWNVSDSCNSVIDFVEGRMRIYEGFHWFHFAKRRAANRWTVHDDGNGYEGTLRRVSATRWNVYRGGRKVKPGVWVGGRYAGYAKGRTLDAIAAGFAYLVWPDCLDL
jgi:hypothetical protein